MSSHYRWDGDDLLLRCQLQPKAASDEICGLYGERLKIRITAPPVEGKANAQLIKLLSKAFKTPKGHITIEQGTQGRQKTVRIHAPQRLPEAALIDTTDQTL